MSTEAKVAKFSQVEVGHAKYTLETAVGEEDVLFILSEVRDMISELGVDEDNDIFVKISGNTLLLRCQKILNRLLDDGGRGMDITIDVLYPNINKNMNPQMQKIADQIVANICKVSGDLGLGDKIFVKA
ncbi:hypothetical protein KJ632_01435 [Patescibacteria group bacterium]|nr:hypothetical protein [Patescibacteria group bacterium]